MKKYSLLAAIAMLTLGFFTSCSKDDDPTPVTKTSLLTAKNWRITAVTARLDNGPLEDFYKNSPNCQKDDFYQFKTDKTFVFDEGKVRCDISNPQTRVSGWDINADGTILLLLEMNGANNAELYEIKELTSSKMLISQTQTVDDQRFLTDITFTAF